MKSTLIIMSIIGTLFLGSAFADEDSNSDRLMERIQLLEEQIAVLQSRFSFASFMPDFAERFHVMHRASEAKDWAVASHELEQMKKLVELSTAIDNNKGILFQAMMGPVLENMESAIGHGEMEKMNELLVQAVQTCNSCHVATGSPSLKVTLDASEALNIRHPHTFTRQETDKSHSH